MKILHVCTVIAAFLVFAAFSQTNAQVAVIVNKSVPVSSLSAGQVGDYYALNTKQWSNGTKVTVFDLKTDGETKSKFYAFLGKSSGDLKKVWMRLKLTGEAEPPTGLSSDDEIVQKVASTPGAIGFVSADKVSGNVKVVAKIP